MKPRQRTRPRSGRPRTGTVTGAFLTGPSTNLGYLRSTLGLFELRRARGCGHAGVLGQPQLQQVAGRHGAFAAYDDDLAEQLLESGRGGAVQRGLSAEDTA